MPKQQLVMITENKDEISYKDMRAFMRTVDKWGLDPSTTKFQVQQDEEHFRIIAPLPSGVRLIKGRFVRFVRKTKHEREIEAQIADHKRKKEETKETEYVPPAGRSGPAKPKKAKCPVCNVRKPIVTIGKVKTIKPHISKGDPCPGGGEQVYK